MRIGDVDAEIGDIWETYVQHPDGKIGRKNRIMILDIVHDRVGPIAWVYILTQPFNYEREGFERFEGINKYDHGVRQYFLLART